MVNRLNKITTEEDIETFFGGPSFSFEYHAKDLEEATNKTIEVVNILVEAKLLSRYIGITEEKKTYDLDEESVAKFIRKGIVEDDFLLNIEGDTTVYLPIDSYPGPKRSVDMSNMITINAIYLPSRESMDITINIRSSIWTPFNIKGYPHIDVYALNLNRLSSALAKIEALGLDPDDEPCCYNDSERCDQSGYLLENRSVGYEHLKDLESEYCIDYSDDSDNSYMCIYGICREDY